MLQRWEQGGFLVFAVLHALCLFILLFFVTKLEKKLEGISSTEDTKGSDTLKTTNNVDKDNDQKTREQKKKEDHKHTNNASLSNLTKKERFFLRFAYPLLGSLFATWSVLLSKSFGELIKASARSGQSQFKRFEVWPILLGLVISLPCQVIYLNKGLSWFEALYIVPIFYSVWVISSIIMGALYFGEFNNFTSIHFCIFFIGVILDIVGGIMLQARGIDSKDDVIHPVKNQNQEGRDAESGDEGDYQLEKKEESVVRSSSSSKIEMIEVVQRKEEEEESKEEEEERKEEESKEEEESTKEQVQRPERIASNNGSATVWHVHPSKKLVE